MTRNRANSRINQPSMCQPLDPSLRFRVLFRLLLFQVPSSSALHRPRSNHNTPTDVDHQLRSFHAKTERDLPTISSQSCTLLQCTVLQQSLKMDDVGKFDFGCLILVVNVGHGKDQTLIISIHNSRLSDLHGYGDVPCLGFLLPCLSPLFCRSPCQGLLG